MAGAAGPAVVLAIDLGTGGPKVALVSADGEVAGDEFEPTPLLLRPGGGVEQSPDGWWAAVLAAARRLLARDLVPEREIAAVAVTGQWAGTVALDAGGAPLMDAVTWLDARGAPYARRIAGGRVRIGGYGPRRLARWVRLTGGAPSLSGRDPVGHILFLAHERPEVHRATATFLEPVDYLNFRLTGRRATSAETATLHWATDTRDLARIAWDDGLLALTGIDRAQLPEIVPTATVLGPLAPAAAAELGLGEHVRVVTATPDTMSAAVGSGAVADYAAHLYVGTSAWLSCHVPFKRTDVRHSIAALPSAVPGRYLVSTEQQTAGASLAHLRDELLGVPDVGFGELIALAEREPAGAGKVIFTPWLNGERTPVDDHLVRGGYHNLSLDTTRGRLVRATLEGVALNARWMQGYVERFVRRPLDDIAFIGGGARSALWSQVFADVLGRRIRQVAEPLQANVRGAAFLAAAALGRLRLEDVADRVPVAATFDPDPEHRAIYDELFAEFRAIYKANRRMYARLNAPA